MTRARVTAQQTARPPKSARLMRGTVAAVSPLTVQIAGGVAVKGLALPGQVYTVGDAVLVAVQEPAVGAVYPLTPTPPPDLTPYARTTDLAPYARTSDLTAYLTTAAFTSTTAGSLTYAGTAANWTSTRVSAVTRWGPLAVLNLQVTVGATPPAAGATIATVPTGYRPAAATNMKATLNTGGYFGHSADLEILPSGAINYLAVTQGVTLTANHGFLGTATYPAA